MARGGGLEELTAIGTKCFNLFLVFKMKLKIKSKPQFDFDVIIEKDEEGYFVASVPALKGCHTQAKSLDVLMERIREAAALCLEVDGRPKGLRQFVGVQHLAI